MRSFAIVATLVAVLCAAPLRAQDQSIPVQMPLDACPANVTLKSDSTALDVVTAEQLLRTLLPAKDLDPDTAFILHVVKLSGEHLAIQDQSWYVYSREWASSTSSWRYVIDSRFRSHFRETRIFGNHKVALATVLLNVNGIPLDAGVNPQALIDDTRDKSHTPLSPADRTALDVLLTGYRENNPVVINGVNKLVDRTNSPLVRLSGKVAVDKAFEPLTGLLYQVDVTKREATPVTDLKGMISIIAMAGPKGTNFVMKTMPINLCGAQKDITIGPVPSDVAVSVQTSTNPLGPNTKIAKQSFLDEQKYWYDFSFGFPFTAVKQLELSDSQQITAKSVKKAGLYALFNASLVPYDLSNAQLQVFPRVVYGMAMTSKPLDHHLLGLAFGLSRVQLIVGYRWDRKEDVSVTTSGNTSTATLAPPVTGSQWDHTFTFGLNLPVSTVTKLLKGGGAGKADGNGTGATKAASNDGQNAQGAKPNAGAKSNGQGGD